MSKLTPEAIAEALQYFFEFDGRELRDKEMRKQFYIAIAALSAIGRVREVAYALHWAADKRFSDDILAAIDGEEKP